MAGRRSVLAFGLVLTMAVAGVAGGTGAPVDPAAMAAQGEAEGACTPAGLVAPAEELAFIESAVPDLALDWVPVPGVTPGEPQPDTHACGGEIRPGARMTNGCTMSWIFEDSSGQTYFSTAGHCTGSVGQRIGIQGLGQVGSVVWRVNGGIGNDFALVKVDPGLAVNPTMCHWGGPTHIATGVEDFVAGNDLTLHYGWGVMWSSQPTRARAGIAGQAAFAGDGSFRWNGFTDGGDSGSPTMLRDGGAAAVHTHTGPAVGGFGQKFGTRLDRVLPRVEASLGIDLDLVPGGPVTLTDALDPSDPLLAPTLPGFASAPSR